MTERSRPTLIANNSGCVLDPNEVEFAKQFRLPKSYSAILAQILVDPQSFGYRKIKEFVDFANQELKDPGGPCKVQEVSFWEGLLDDSGKPIKLMSTDRSLFATYKLIVANSLYSNSTLVEELPLYYLRLEHTDLRAAAPKGITLNQFEKIQLGRTHGAYLKDVYSFDPEFLGGNFKLS